MKTIQFIAPDATSAIELVRERLGPDAVVLSVKPLKGFARLFHRGGIKVVAGLPESTNDSPVRPRSEESGAADVLPPESGREKVSKSNRWQSVAWLQAMGLLPAFAERLEAHLKLIHAGGPLSLDDEWTLVNAALNHFWKIAPPFNDVATPRPHVFIGPPGCGKTTVLCKWLTLAVLTEERSARVWRLDGCTANTAEFLSVHGEMLGVPIERFWSNSTSGADLYFVDLPGVETQDTHALAALRAQLATLPGARVHLVLNAAYETSTLLTQCAAFAAFEPEDLIFTHLDEETQRVKLWNFVFGTDFAIRFLSAGQKIPGEFCTAAPRLLFPPS